MSALHTFRVRLITRGFYDGLVKARSRDEAVDLACWLWNNDSNHPFWLCDDDELAEVSAEEEELL